MVDAQRKSNQIHRYYDERSRHNIVQADLFMDVGDLPFDASLNEKHRQ